MVDPDNSVSDSTPSPGGSDEDAAIQFHFEDVQIELPETRRLRDWIEQTIARESATLNFVSFVFCSDAYLLDLNIQYLNHDTLTDVITFPYLQPPFVEGDIFISTERVADNARVFGVSFEHELLRVMIHGVLHLCGYGDKTPEEKQQMTHREDEALSRCWLFNP